MLLVLEISYREYSTGGLAMLLEIPIMNIRQEVKLFFSKFLP